MSNEDWARKVFYAIGDNDRATKEESISHITDKFHIRQSWFYKFEDESYLEIVVRGEFNSLYIIDKEKFDKKKKEYVKWAESVNLQKVRA